MHVCSFDSIRGMVFAVFVAVTVVSVSTTASAAAKRNVVLIVADDLGLQLGCYGDQIAKTRNIDALAAQSVRFTQAFCTTASCSASRSVLMTGLHNHATGHYGHAHGVHHFSTYETVRTLPVILTEAGYRTCLIGKYHLAPEYVYKFETQRQDGTQSGRNTLRMANNAKAWLTEKDDRPFFLYFCPTDPHRGSGAGGFSNFSEKPNFYGGIPAGSYKPSDVAVPSWLPDQPEVRAELAEYYQAIARLDYGVGVLMTALKETGHFEDTLILFLSDNGPPFPGAKTTVYEPGVKLPLIVRDPQSSRQGQVCKAPVTWADITPTILDFCGIELKPAPPVRPAENVGKIQTSGTAAAYKFHGKSFLKMLANGETQDDLEREVLLSHTFHEITNYYPMRVVRRGQFKLIFNVAHPLPFPFASDLEDSATWKGVRERNDLSQLYGKRAVHSLLNRLRFELFDLENDPDEIRNLANEPSHQKTLETLKSSLRRLQEETSDPWARKWDYE